MSFSRSFVQLFRTAMAAILALDFIGRWIWICGK